MDQNLGQVLVCMHEKIKEGSFKTISTHFQFHFISDSNELCAGLTYKAGTSSSWDIYVVWEVITFPGSWVKMSILIISNSLTVLQA